MKSFKNLAFVTASLSLALLSACNENNEEIADVAAQRTIIANADYDTPMSRSAIDPANYSDGAVGILWTPDDAIGVFSASDKNARFRNMASVAQGRTVFSGNLAGTPLYAYYPYSELNAGLSADALMGNLPLTQTYDASTGLIEGDWKYGSPRKDAAEEFDFKHLFSLFKISVNVSNTQMVGENLRKVILELPEGRTLGGDFTFSAITGAYTMPHTDGSNILTMQWNGDGLLSAGTTRTGYISCAPDIKADDELTVKVVTDKRIATFTAHAAYDFAASAIYTFDLNMATIEQKFDVSYEAIPVEPEEETANCYMITTAGEHDFKATVIGNGEKGIIKGAGFHTEDPNIDPKSARLLWEDTEGFVTDVKLVDGRVHYTTTDNVGNAVIAVYDGTAATSNILWSWHIWGVGSELPADDELTNYDGAKFSVMNRTLGSRADNPNMVMLYQWGRKDPIPNDTIAWVNGKQTEISEASTHYYYHVRNFTSSDDDEATIAMSIKNPTCFFNRSKNLSDGNWLNTENLNLWGNTITVDQQRETPTEQTYGKTIYDPSPVGYRVPNCRTFSGFSQHEGGTNASVGNYRVEWINYVKYDKGYWFKRNSEDTEGTLFPMTGSRGGYFGMIHSYTGSGSKKKYYWNGNLVAYYWYSNAVPSTSGKGRSSCFTLTKYVENNTGGTAINSNNTIKCFDFSDRSTACAVRCVRE